MNGISLLKGEPLVDAARPLALAARNWNAGGHVRPLRTRRWRLSSITPQRHPLRVAPQFAEQLIVERELLALALLPRQGVRDRERHFRARGISRKRREELSSLGDNRRVVAVHVVALDQLDGGVQACAAVRMREPVSSSSTRSAAAARWK